MGNKVKILIIEDSTIVVNRLLESINWLNQPVVKHVRSGDKVDILLARDIPDVIVLDINLPGTNGINVLRKIREIDKNVVVIMFTNKGNDYYRTHCKRAGADFFFDKSDEVEKMLDLLASIRKNKNCENQ